MNKKGLQFKALFISIIAMSMCVIAIEAHTNSWNTTYGSDLDYDLQDFNKLDDVSNTADIQQKGVTVKSSNTEVRFEDTSIRGVYGILSNIYEPFRIVFGDDGMIDSLGKRLGLPDYIGQGGVTMMIIAITFALVAIFFRLSRNP